MELNPCGNQHDGAEQDPEQARNDAQNVSRTFAHHHFDDVDAHMTALEQDVWRAEKHGCGCGKHDEVRLPDRRLTKYIALHDHLADDEHRRNEQGRRNGREATRSIADSP